ncbi:MAG: bifunctional oligoribonuclease/PAP phosphatase NrnA [Bacteroidota bacterium]
MNSEIDKINQFRDAIAIASHPLIVCHVNPDGDTIGTALAFYLFFQANGKQAHVVSPGPLPSFLEWMPAAKDITLFTENPDAVKSLFAETDLLLCVDFNATIRAGNLKTFIEDSKAVKVLIDHHPDPESFASICFSDIKSSSTSEIACNLFLALSETELFDPKMAACLYTGIMTDTGCYSYSCSDKTHSTTAVLLKSGIDAARIHQLVYDTYSEKRMRLLGFCLSRRMVVNVDNHSAYIYLSKEDRELFNYQTGDSEGLVNYGLSIGHVVFAAIIIERQDEVKLSFRSKGDFNVNEFARKYFNGGGHKNAAGASSFVSLKETIKKLEEAINENHDALLLQHKKLYHEN